VKECNQCEYFSIITNTTDDMPVGICAATTPAWVDEVYKRVRLNDADERHEDFADYCNLFEGREDWV